MNYTRQELERVTLTELKKIGTRYQIKGRGKWKKADAIDAILGHEAMDVPVVNVDDEKREGGEEEDLTREKLEKMTVVDLKKIGTKNNVKGRSSWTKNNRDVAINAILGQNMVVVDDEIVEIIHEAEEKLEMEVVLEDQELTRENLEQMTLAELRKIGTKLKINGRGKWTKPLAVVAILENKIKKEKLGKKRRDAQTKRLRKTFKIPTPKEVDVEEVEFVPDKAQRQYNEEIEEKKEERFVMEVARREAMAQNYINDKLWEVERREAVAQKELEELEELEGVERLAEMKEIMEMFEDDERDAANEELRKVFQEFDPKPKQHKKRIIPKIEINIQKCLGLIY
jgi:hypothetical protein